MSRLTVSLGPAGVCVVLAGLVAYGAAVFLAARAVYREDPVAVAVPARGQEQAMRRAPASFADDAGALVDWKFFRRAPATGAGAPAAAAGDVASLVRRADEAYAAREYAAAAADYERALALAPGNTDVENNLGLVLHYAGRDAQALERLEAATRRDPGHQRSWLTLGYVRMNTGDARGAEQALARARDLDPQSTVGSKAASYLQFVQ